MSGGRHGGRPRYFGVVLSLVAVMSAVSGLILVTRDTPAAKQPDLHSVNNTNTSIDKTLPDEGRVLDTRDNAVGDPQPQPSQSSDTTDSSVTVNGTEVRQTGPGSVHRVFTTDDGQSSADVRVDNKQRNTGGTNSSQSSVNVTIE